MGRLFSIWNYFWLCWRHYPRWIYPIKEILVFEDSSFFYPGCENSTRVNRHFYFSQFFQSQEIDSIRWTNSPHYLWLPLTESLCCLFQEIRVWFGNCSVAENDQLTTTRSIIVRRRLIWWTKCPRSFSLPVNVPKCLFFYRLWIRTLQHVPQLANFNVRKKKQGERQHWGRHWFWQRRRWIYEPGTNF